MVKLINNEFSKNKIKRNTQDLIKDHSTAKIKILTTDESPSFKDLAAKILNLSQLDFQLINLI
jgi:hypothetical protein